MPTDRGYSDNVIFLDIDGVLNNHQWARKNNSIGKMPYEDLDPENVHCLMDFYFKNFEWPNLPKFVLCSSWRLYHSRAVMDLFLANNGLGIMFLYDRTPWVNLNKGVEIKRWLEMNPCKGKYVILVDKGTPLDGLDSYAVFTDPEIGLTRQDTDKMLEMLQ